MEGKQCPYCELRYTCDDHRKNSEYVFQSAYAYPGCTDFIHAKTMDIWRINPETGEWVAMENLTPEQIFDVIRDGYQVVEAI